jgi:hypothetical protein
VYSELVTAIRRYGETRGPLFVDQTAEIWQALFEHVAVFHACRTADGADPPGELQVLWDYLDVPQERSPTPRAGHDPDRRGAVRAAGIGGPVQGGGRLGGPVVRP